MNYLVKIRIINLSLIFFIYFLIVSLIGVDFMFKKIVLCTFLGASLFAGNKSASGLVETISDISIPESNDVEVENDELFPKWVVDNFEKAMYETCDEMLEKQQIENDKFLPEREANLKATRIGDALYFENEEKRIKYIIRHAHKLDLPRVTNLTSVIVSLNQLKKFADKHYEFHRSLLDMYPGIGGINVPKEIMNVYFKLQDKVSGQISEYYDIVTEQHDPDEESIYTSTHSEN